MATTGQEALTGALPAMNGRIPSPWEMSSKIDFTWAPPLLEQPIHAGRHVRVVCIGAGFSGLGVAVTLKKELQNFDLQLYEKNDDVGGVWHINRYPGVACDVPSHTYQYTFCENTQWSAFYAPGSEIQAYLAKVAEHYDIRKLIKLSHEVVSAIWGAEAGKWTIVVRDLTTGEVFEDVADFVIHSTGLLSKPQFPNIEGLHDFNGLLRHSGTWDAAKDEATEGFDWSKLRVGVIGNGASGVQIVPTLQKKAKQVLNFGRSKVWLSAGYGSGALGALRPGSNDTSSNYYFTPEEQTRFRDADSYNVFRKGIEAELASAHHLTLQGNTFQEGFREKLTRQMRGKTTTKPHVAEAMLPDFPVGCKRLTPGPGYLEALCEDNAELITTPILRVTEKGIITTDGVEHELDMIVCATGFDVRLMPQFPIYGLGGVLIQDAWAKETRSYLGITASELPNSFNILTTQAAVGSGSVLTTMERQSAYVAAVIAKCQRDHYKSVVVKPEAVTDFLRYTDDYFKRTVYATNCKSWYKLGQAGEATIRSIWPGSGLHAYMALREPRWEDYNWERMPESAHSMSWLGNGDVVPHLDRHFAYEHMRSYHEEPVLW